MRPCYNIHCENGKEVEYTDDDTKIVTDIDCHDCNGAVEVEDVCYCHAYEPNECCCGAWSPEDTENWYDVDDYLDYKDEQEYEEMIECYNEIEGE